jgi:TatD DNase family protein
MLLFDAHCHLQDKRYGDRLPLIIGRAHAAGVERMMCCGSEENDWEAVKKIACEYKNVLPSFGMHPLYLRGHSDKWLENLKACLLAVPSGVGEIGLDSGMEPYDEAGQEKIFTAQLRLARELNRPVTIHCRKAWGKLLEILKQQGGVPSGGVLHTYSGSAEMVPVFEEMGLYISFSGAITRPGSKRAHRALAAVSPERLLIETDSPDILPVGATGELNEPANLVIIARCVAALLGKSFDEVAELTYKNAERLFLF